MKSFFILSIIIILISIIILVLYIKILKESKKSKRLIKETNIIREILDTGLKNKNEDISEINKTLENVQYILKKNYNMSYCTLLIYSGKFTSISSDVDNKYIHVIEDYCNNIYNEMKESENINVKIEYVDNEDEYLNYPSARERYIKYALFQPLEIKGTIFASIFIENISGVFDIELEFLQMISENISLVIQNSIYKEEITSMAMKDELTKMYNRNYMNIHLNNQMMFNRNFSLAMFDIDHFKKINDTYGHDFGDIVLKEVSNFIKDNIRLGDKVFRWGGEEFVIFIEKSNVKDAYKRIDNIRDKLSKFEIKNEKGIKANVSASFGLCEYPQDGRDIDTLIRNVDKALYYSKENGRNNTTIYSKGLLSSEERII